MADDNTGEQARPKSRMDEIAGIASAIYGAAAQFASDSDIASSALGSAFCSYLLNSYPDPLATFDLQVQQMRQYLAQAVVVKANHDAYAQSTTTH